MSAQPRREKGNPAPAFLLHPCGPIDRCLLGRAIPPKIGQLLPVIAKIINGQTATEADAAAVRAAIQALEAQVASREAAVSTT